MVENETAIMQTQQVLPIQIQGASATPNKAGGASQGGGEFSQALFDSRQAMRNQAQARSNGAPAPRPNVQDKPAPKQPEATGGPKPGSEDHVAKAAQEAATSGAAAEVPASQANNGSAKAASGSSSEAGSGQAAVDAQARADAQAKADAEAAAAADAAAITPVADMLALMAAFNQPAQAADIANGAAAAAAVLDSRSLGVSPADAAAAAAAAEAAALAGASGADALGAASAADAAALAAANAAANAAATAGTRASVAADAGADAGKAAEGAIKLDAAVLAAQEALDPALADAAKQAASKQAAPVDSAFAKQLAQAGEAKPVEPGLPGTASAQSGLKLEAALRSTRAETGAGDATVDTAATDAKPELKPLAAGVQAAVAQQKPEVAIQQNAPRTEPHELAAVREAAPQPASFQQAINTSLQAAQAANVAASDRIPARVGTPAWDNQVTQKVIFMAAGGEQSASLTLNPPELGPMQVVLSVSNDTTNVTFSAAQPEVRHALENSMPKLREMLAESGISLGNANVNANMPDQAQANANANQGGSHGGGHGQGRFNNGNNVAAADTPAPRPSRRNENGLVDTFA
jgi:flagellar hook-length control protein FliK